MKATLICTGLLTLIGCTPGAAQTVEPATAHYLANEGVMIVRGDTKVVFDPLFDNTYGQYQAMPNDMRQQLFAGEPPYDGIDAVLISHYHGDHFSPELMASFLDLFPKIKLIAPRQAVEALRDITKDQNFDNRVTTIDLANGDKSVALSLENINIEAVRIPHAGWPARADVQNIVYRVTLEDDITVMHLGDADTAQSHYAQHEAHWSERTTHMAFVPYWFFQSDDGRATLDKRVRPHHAVGVHVPAEMPDDPVARPAEYRGFDLFTEPRETRTIRRSNTPAGDKP